MFEIKSENIPIKLWLAEIEEGAMQQAKNIANLPSAFHHIAIMPDAHQGFGMPIGGVLATRGEIVPNAVGVDIGCGMIAVRTSVRQADRDVLLRIMEGIKRRIPLGFKHHSSPQKWEGFERAPRTKVVRQELENARYQLGTLGGGNHFIELQRGDDGYLWVMLHSGSRNFGYTIAREYDKVAREQTRRRGITVPDAQLGMLKLDSQEGQDYLAAMGFAQEFAAANRDRMLRLVKEVLESELPGIEYNKEVNIHHNFAALEKHFGAEVVVHRKGATEAGTGQPGIVPGSQGSPSYIVEGLGNPESFASCSHGAGRLMGRKEAQRTLDLSREQRRLEQEGILHSLHSRKDLEEAAGAYKDIHQVMQLQRDLVRITVTLQPLAVIKG